MRNGTYVPNRSTAAAASELGTRPASANAPAGSAVTSSGAATSRMIVAAPGMRPASTPMLSMRAAITAMIG
jgi:hypothetical protein